MHLHQCVLILWFLHLVSCDANPTSGPPAPSPPVVAPLLIPGNGFTGSTPQPPPVGSGVGVDAKAIARWNVVPGQTFQGEFELGVLAFHRNGIQRIDASAEGGPWTTLSRMELNPRTQTYEFWGRVRASDFEDRRIEVRAIAYPEVGIPRVLDSLTLWANHGGSLDARPVYVSVNGSDTNPGTSNQPLRTIASALGTVSDGGDVIISEPGIYDVGTSNSTATRWVTVMSAPGLNRSQVTITQSTRSVIQPRVRKLRWSGVTFDFKNISQYYPETGDAVWFDDCRWFDSDGWTTKRSGQTSNIRSLWQVMSVPGGGIYATDCVAENMLYGFIQFSLVRGCHMEKISGDACGNSMLVVNSTAHDVDGTLLDHHTDLLQYFGHFENVIVFGLKATKLNRVQSIFLDHYKSSFSDCAFVNIMVENFGLQPPFSQLNASHDHVIFAHLSLPAQLLIFRDDLPGAKKFTATNVVFLNCILERLKSEASGYSLPSGVEVSSCHYTMGPPLGTDTTKGSIQFVNGPGSTFSYAGEGAGKLIGTARPVPGLEHPRLGESTERPNRGAFPFAR